MFPGYFNGKSNGELKPCKTPRNLYGKETKSVNTKCTETAQATLVRQSIGFASPSAHRTTYLNVIPLHETSGDLVKY